MKVLFNSIIRTMYSGCYYKKGSRVIYLYDIKQTGDSQTVIFFECEHISRPKEITVLYNEFRPVGEPKSVNLIDFELEFRYANNLNQRCLGCIYCKATDMFTDVNKRADSCDIRYAKSLLCELRLAFVTLSAVSLLTCNCEYRRAEPPELITCNAGIIDFKKSVLKIVEECSKPIGSSDLLAMSPELFDILLKMLHPDDVIFFGSGDSAGNYRPVMHESVWDYLAFPGEDADVICIRAKNASKELYAYMMSETSETPRYALLFPSISTAYYGDDLTIGGSCAYSYGYAVYAPQNIAEQILAKTQECKPIQLNNNLKL